MKSYEQCCQEVAVKYHLGTKLVTGHLAKYRKEAAEMYAGQTREQILLFTSFISDKCFRLNGGTISMFGLFAFVEDSYS